MNILLRWSLPFAVLLVSVLFSVSGHAARDDEDDWDDEMEEVGAEELSMQDIPVDERIFIKPRTLEPGAVRCQPLYLHTSTDRGTMG